MDAPTLEPLEDLLSRAEFAHLMILTDEAGDVLYRISYRLDGRRHTCVSSSLGALLHAISLDRPTQTCSRCGHGKPIEEFPRAPVRPSRPHGRHDHCILCDRARKKKYGPRAARGLTKCCEPAAQAQ